MKNFIIQHLSAASDKASAGIFGCLADGTDVQYECWTGMTVKALHPDKVQFLRTLINNLLGSITFKCDYEKNQKCREFVYIFLSSHICTPLFAKSIIIDVNSTARKLLT